MADLLKSTLTKLAIGPSDLLIVTVHPDDDAIGIGERLRRVLKRRGIDNTLIVCREKTAIENLDPDTMARHGWHRQKARRRE